MLYICQMAVFDFNVYRILVVALLPPPLTCILLRQVEPTRSSRGRGVDSC
jgi:hypothetical protein